MSIRSSTRHHRVHSLYAPLVSSARARISNDRALAPVVASDADPDLVLGFLIQFCALGVEMTRPVDQWIARAGRRCQELGHHQLGRALVMHAQHEAGHHELMLADLGHLVARWNRGPAGRDKLEVASLLDQPATEAMRRYRAIHEDTIATAPYGQVAIEYEIEGMSVVLGPVLLESCRTALGPEIVAEMSFIYEHTTLDVGHTAMNEAELERFLAVHPDTAESLARVGSEALHIYLDFLGDCVELGRALQASTNGEAGLSC